MYLLKKLLLATLSLPIIVLANSSVDKLEKPDVNRGEAIYTKGLADKGVPACLSCHGALGNSGGSANPKLAGQHSAYLYKQLQDFKAKTQRNNPIMSPYAASLTNQQMQDVSAYLNKQTMKIGSAKTSEGIELGKKIYRGGIASKGVPACAACHSPNGAGIPSQYARIGGQWADYTKAQLLAFKSGARSNGPMMATIASRMSDKEIDAVADYIAGLH